MSPIRTLVALATFGLALVAWGQMGTGGSLNGLTAPRGGKVAHFSSTDPKRQNNDSRRVEPGQTYTLVDYRGAGIVRRWWITLAPRNNVQIQRQCIVRCYWDGETQPSVEVPVSDFFGVGFGEWKQFQSMPLEMTSGGYNCYWPMPFHRSARITFENRSKIAVDALYYNVDVETHPSIPADSLYFHAQFRRANPPVNGQPVTILETTGKGQYVGTLLSMQDYKGSSLGFLEGNERVFVDGENEPSIAGTGTEDYFSSGWYFDTGEYSAPYHGLTIKDTKLGRISAYRWHIEDAIPFEKSIQFTIEHGAMNDFSKVDYTSVAFWYQTHPHPPFPTLPDDLLPIVPTPIPHIPDMIEAEGIASPAVTGGDLSVQEMDGYDGTWSGDQQLFWMADKLEEKLTLTIDSPKEVDADLVGYLTKAADYGTIRVSLNDQASAVPFDGYADHVTASGPVQLGKFHFLKGPNHVVIAVTGKNDRSAGYFVGIDGFVLKPAP